MIFKEDSILFPMTMDNLTEDDWIRIADDSDEIGYCLIEPDKEWVPERVDVEEKEKKESVREGMLNLKQEFYQTRKSLLSSIPYLLILLLLIKKAL